MGRCDHSYAHYLANYYNRGTKNEDKASVTLFLKDNDNNHRSVYSRRRSLTEMVTISQQRGFACQEERVWAISRQTDDTPPEQVESHHGSSWMDVAIHPVCQISAYHNWTQLQQKQMTSYYRLRRDNVDTGAFQSTHGKTLGDYAQQMGIEISEPIVPVCYGGNFLVSNEQLDRYRPAASSSSPSLWSKMEASLSRASSVAEGHFVERLWAALLSSPLEPSEVELLETIASEKQPSCTGGGSFQGALTRY